MRRIALHPFVEYVNPHLGRLLSRINMDKTFVRGEGCYLYDSEGRRYLDLIASYGALAFGYNPPEIWNAIEDLRRSAEPSFVQPSYLEAAGKLAKRLIEIAPPGLKYVTFTNSGAEAAEAAIKLARAATGRRRILAAWNSFHGKTLGALSATGKETYQKAFGAPIEGFDFVPYQDIAAVEELFEHKGKEYAAFILEPIQGEGGIVVPAPGYLSRVRDLCTRYGVLLILDEVQTGLGRTGRMFACEEEGVRPDVMLLAKALGGGMVPIGAVLSTEEAYSEDFALKHSSTFAGNALACRVALASLELLTKDNCSLIRQVEENGRLLKEGLLSLRDKYPNVIRSIRGRGLMLGIEFGITRDTFPGSLIGVMAEQEILTPVISSYLLNVEGLRVAPTLNGSDVIRIEPPLVISKEQCLQAIEGLGRGIKVLAEGNTAKFLEHFTRDGSRDGNDVCPSVSKRIYVSDPVSKPIADPTDGRFAFLVHPINIKNYPEFDRSLEVFSEDELKDLADRWNDLVDPFVLSEARIVSRTGAAAFGQFIAVPRTADDLLYGDQGEVMSILKKAVQLAKERGAKIVGLGAYTSVASRGGRSLLDEGVAITTGNSYTVVSAVEAVTSAMTRLNMDPSRVTVSVVGATGSIGRAISILLSEQVSKLILVGNPKRPEKSQRRLVEVVAAISRHLLDLIASGKTPKPGSIVERAKSKGLIGSVRPLQATGNVDECIRVASQLEDHGFIVLTTDADRYLPASDVVVTATSSLAELVTPGNVRWGAVVLDLSRPPNVSRRIRDLRPDVLVIDGGIVALPGLPSLGWDFGFERGLAYACMAETIMLALEHHYEHTSIGADLDIDTILYTKDLAEKHGFTLADLRSFDRPLTKEEWEHVVVARQNRIGPKAYCCR